MGQINLQLELHILCTWSQQSSINQELFFMVFYIKLYYLIPSMKRTEKERKKGVQVKNWCSVWVFLIKENQNIEKGSSWEATFLWPYIGQRISLWNPR